MPMPYRIEFTELRTDVTRDRAPPNWPKGQPWKRPAEREYAVNRVGVKVYPNGLRVEATPEEVAMWEHVQGLAEAGRLAEQRRVELAARNEELQRQLAGAQAGNATTEPAQAAASRGQRVRDRRGAAAG